MSTGNSPPWNPIAINVQIAAEILACLQIFRAHHLAAIVAALVIPFEWLAQPVIHPDVEIKKNKNRRLQSICQVKRLRAKGEALVGIFRKQHYMLGIAM